MIIVITSAEIDSASGKFCVRCSSSYGDFCGIWESHQPLINGNYHVELTIPEVYTWGDTISQARRREYRVQQDAQQVSFTGMLDSVDDDGVACIRLGESIFLIDAEGEPIPVGEYVSFQSSHVRLFAV